MTKFGHDQSVHRRWDRRQQVPRAHWRHSPPPPTATLPPREYDGPARHVPVGPPAFNPLAPWRGTRGVKLPDMPGAYKLPTRSSDLGTRPPSWRDGRAK